MEKTWSYALLVIYVAQVSGNYINPVALVNIGWRFYIYCSVWITCIFAMVYFFFLETSGSALEEIGLIFDDKAVQAADRKVSLVDDDTINAANEDRHRENGRPEKDGTAIHID